MVHRIAVNRKIYVVESLSAVVDDVPIRPVVDTDDTNGNLPATPYKAAVFALPGDMVTEGADPVHAAPNVTTNIVADVVAVVPVMSVTTKP